MLQPPRHAPAATQPPVNTNRAFNIHNMETLEAALQLADVQPPPQNVVDRVRLNQAKHIWLTMWVWGT